MNEESLFAAVLEKPTHHDRLAHLESVCANDSALLQRMNLLLASHEQARGILDRTNFLNGVAVNTTPAGERCGSVVGPYVLKDLLGEGGFGQVYVAEQYHPVRREVAVKLIKPGMNSREVLARFEGERQALALMEHSNIARVLDAGTTEEGCPYFVMELVRGVPITEFADSQRLDTQARLKLFSSVCMAVHHAHQKGILHRDLKPSNVLVTTQDEHPVVKVIDFGVAKALHQPLIDDPFLTHAHQMIGTPAYMSPEQAGMNAQDVDTRTDIYSLGVLLYEVLVGTTPFDRERLLSAGYDEMRRIIREEEPLSPSTRISTLGILATTVSTHRQANPRQLSQLLRGELDWIVMKAIEKDRNRRYASASDLARDIERYLAHETLEASPPSTLYRVKKYLQRNRGVVLAAISIFVLLVSGIIGTSMGMLYARDAQKAEAKRAEGEVRERQRAERAEAIANDKARIATIEAETALALVDFLRNDLLSQTASGIQSGRFVPPNPQMTVGEALDQAAARIAKRFNNQPEVEAKIRCTIANAYYSLGFYTKAETHFQRGVELMMKLLGPEHVETLKARTGLANANHRTGNRKASIAQFEQIHEIRSRNLGPDHASTLLTLNDLAVVYRDLQNHDKALAIFEQVNAANQKVHGPHHPSTLITLRNIAHVHMDLGHLDKVVEMNQEILQLTLDQYGSEHPESLLSQHHLAVSYWKSKRLDLSVPLFEKLLPQFKKIIGESHFDTYLLMSNLGINYCDQGRVKEAIPLLVVAYEGHKTFSTLRTIVAPHLLNAYVMAGDQEKAKALVRQTLATSRRLYESNSKRLASELMNYAGKLIEVKAWVEAEALLRDASIIWEDPPAHTINVLINKSLLAHSLIGQVQSDPKRIDRTRMLSEAELLLLHCYKEFVARDKSLSPAASQSLGRTLNLIIECYQLKSMTEEVRKWQTERAKRPRVLPD